MRALFFLSIFFLLFHLAAAQEMTQVQINQWSHAVDTLFDSHGNLVDISKYDYSFADTSQRFQKWPFPLKALFNNHRIQVNLVLSPTTTKRFGIVLADEKITSFTSGTLANASMQVTLDNSTFEAIQSDSANETNQGPGIAAAVKSGKLMIETHDFFSGLAISFYKAFI